MNRESIIRIGIRLWTEFRIPFFVAVLWALFRYLFQHYSVAAQMIVDFSTAFFLASWFVGNFFRVERNLAVSDDLNDIRQASDQIQTQVQGFEEDISSIKHSLDELRAQNPHLGATIDNLTVRTAHAIANLESVRSANTVVNSTASHALSGVEARGIAGSFAEPVRFGGVAANGEAGSITGKSE